MPRACLEPPEAGGGSAEIDKGVWERKSATEIRALGRRRRFSPVPSLIFAFIMALIWTGSRWMGWHGQFRPTTAPLPFLQAFAVFPFSFAIAFLFFYLVQLLSRVPRVADHDSMICDTCHQVTGYTSQKRCACGGRMEFLTHWRWIPEDASKLNPYV